MLNLILNIIGSQIFSGGVTPFPCTIVSAQEYTLENDLITNCDPILIES